MSFRNTLRRLRETLSSSRPAARQPQRSRPLAVEPLEGRTLLSVIVWNNRGTCEQASCSGQTSDSDRFFQHYGANAGRARAIVLTAIQTWQNTILNFNYRNVGQQGFAPIANLYGISVSAVNFVGSQLGLAGPSGDAIDRDGRPWRGTVSLDNNGGGGGWYFDPNPADHGEFTTPLNRFAATGTMAGTDFYSVIMHEMGHAFGLLTNTPALRINSRISNPNLPAPNSDLRTFTFLDGTRATLTTNGGGHTFDRAAPAGHFTYPNDLMNPGIGSQTRRLISDVDARILGDGQGYSISQPSIRETFLAAYNSATRVLTVHGEPSAVDDSIILDIAGPNVLVIVNNVASRWPISSLSEIRVQSGAGRDTITLHDLPAVPVTVDAGNGDDTIFVRAARAPLTVSGGGGLNNTVTIGFNGRLTNILAPVTVSDPGYTALTIDNSADTVTHTVTLTATSLSFGNPNATINWVQNDLRALTIRGGNGLNTYQVVNTPQSGIAGGVTTTLVCGTGLDTVNLLATTGVINILGGGGPDAVNLGNNGSIAGIQGSMTLSNTGGHRTRVTVDDRNRAGAFPAVTLDNLITDAEYIRLTGLTNATIYSRCRDTQDYTLRTGTGTVTTNVTSTCPIQSSLAIQGNSANTTVNVGSNGRLTNIRGRVHFDSVVAGGALVVNNAADPFARTVTFTSNSLSFGNPDATINWNRLGSLTVHGGQGSDIYDVRATALGVPVQVNGGGGDDTFLVSSTAAGTMTILNGGDGNDGFILGDGLGLNGIAGSVRLDGQTGAGGGGFARVNDSNLAVAREYTWNGSSLRWGAVTVEAANLGAFDLIGGQAGDIYSVSALGPISLNVADAGGTDTVFGPEVDTTWNLTAPNAWTVNDRFFFSGVEHLRGGAATDTFRIADGVSFSGTVNGGDGNNTLDYSAWTSGVYVDLSNFVALQGPAEVYNVAYVFGGAGDDFIHGDFQDNWLIGNGGHDILVGDEGGDWLQGGDGADQLYGGNGFDQLDGGNGEDLLLGGPSIYDNDVAALSEIWAEWTRTDLVYADRIAVLRTGTASGYLLELGTTVFEDADADLLNGEGDLDWFWGTDGFDVMDRIDPNEVLN